jgi:cyclopropane-fatty-acyl-phospholipid synthase
MLLDQRTVGQTMDRSFHLEWERSSGHMVDSDQAQRAAILRSVFQEHRGTAFAIRLWNGWQWSSSANETAACAIVIANPDALSTLIARPNEVTLGEAFVRGDLDVEGDLFSVFEVAEHLFNRPKGFRQRVLERLGGAALGLQQRLKQGAVNSRKRDRLSIAYHYDLPAEFFEPWLGRSMVYSCAYFDDRGDSLEAAQERKLDLICRKLGLQQGERFLDIGCGWGSLVLRAAEKWDARADGITLSREQVEVGRRRIASSDAKARCSVELRDYRDLTGEGTYDKIASVGMFEHVGPKNLPVYFGIVKRLLRPGGLFLNHGIARTATLPARESSFIRRHVFPDGKLVTLSETLNAAEAQGLEVRDVENLREHYELTLRRWADGLQKNADSLIQRVSKTKYRIWLLYAAGCAAAFRRGDMAVHQVLLSRPDPGKSSMPLTRANWYR